MKNGSLTRDGESRGLGAAWRRRGQVPGCRKAHRVALRIVRAWLGRLLQSATKGHAKPELHATGCRAGDVLTMARGATLPALALRNG